MSEINYNFVGWEEHVICQERGNRVVHLYLKETSGILMLAVVGKERSIRHMIYVVRMSSCRRMASMGSSMPILNGKQNGKLLNGYSSNSDFAKDSGLWRSKTSSEGNNNCNGVIEVVHRSLVL
ncbi:hypothetical protein CRYUN_Cryun28dG0004900 [Craigia yunnanensis]